MKKSYLFLAIILLLVSLMNYGCGAEDSCNCSIDEMCVSGECKTTCSETPDCTQVHGGGWICVDGQYCDYVIAESLDNNSDATGGEQVTDGDTQPVDGDVTDFQPDGDIYDGPVEVNCIPHDEECNGRDDDCDGAIDETFNLSEDIENCGECGNVCEAVNAAPTCLVGVCYFTCDQYFYDIDGFIENGCEYYCVQTFGGEELCDGADNNCNGSVDENCSCLAGATRACGRTEGICESGVQTCTLHGQWGSCEGEINPFIEFCDGLDEDCDGAVDEDFFIGVPCRGIGACGVGTYECHDLFTPICSTSPGGSGDQSTPEACGNNVDDNCNGQVDEICVCDPGDMLPCGSSDVGECQRGWQTCNADGTWGACVGSIEPATEICNGLDDDCDGLIDSSENDVDRDSFRVCQGDCDDRNYFAYPGAQELCNSVDDNCNGSVDENYYVGAPCRAEGACGYGVYECDTETTFVCSTAPYASNDQSSQETCDGVDNNCDGTVDEYCSCLVGNVRPCGSNVGECKFGRQTCLPGGLWGDCLEGIQPKPELCNGLDDDCDGVISSNENDIDNDGFRLCDRDCNDTDENIYPGAQEWCNGLDDDCDGAKDEDYYVGALCGGEGVCGVGEYECAGLTGVRCSTNPGGLEDQSRNELCGNNADDNCNGSVDENCDCDPGNIRPCGHNSIGVCKLGIQTCDNAGNWGACLGAILSGPEVCNGLDDDCNGTIPANEADADRDGYSVCEGDCNDADRNVNPTAFDLCDGIDNNCNGVKDDGNFIGVPCRGIGACGAGVYECANEYAYKCSTSPGASHDESSAEVCGDNVDNDCDEFVDEGCVCDPGEKIACGTTSIGQCMEGSKTCQVNGQWGVCVGNIEPTNEVCNGLDDDCNGSIPNTELDRDQDGFKTCENDCNDNNANINPRVAELCNGVDDNCNSLIDEIFFVGATCTGLGRCGQGLLECATLNSVRCSTASGGSASQAVTEVCGNNVDDDCDGSVDEGCVCDPGDQLRCGSANVGDCRYGWQTCGADAMWGACQGAVLPSAEVCDYHDNDCDGSNDETFNLATDVNNCGACGTACAQVAHATIACVARQCVISSCNSSYWNLDGQYGTGCEYQCLATRGGTEYCDLIDNDCDGTVDEACIP